MQRPPADQSNVLRWWAGVPGGGSGGVSGATTSSSGGPPCLPISQRMAAAAGTSAGATVCAIRPRGTFSSRLAANATVTPTRALYSASSAAMTAASETPLRSSARATWHTRCNYCFCLEGYVWQTFNSDSAVTICLANRDDAIPAAASKIVNIVRGSVRQQGFRTNDAERDTCLIEWRIGRGHWIGMIHRLGCKGQMLRQRKYAQYVGAKSIAHVRQWYATRARAGALCSAPSEQTHARATRCARRRKHIPRKHAPSNAHSKIIYSTMAVLSGPPAQP